MIQKPHPAPPTPCSADPHTAALSRIAALVARGYDADRLQREAEAVIQELRGAMDSEELREVLDDVREQLAAGVEAAAEQAGEIDGDDKASARNVQRMVGAMTAARDVFGQAAGAMFQLPPCRHGVTRA